MTWLSCDWPVQPVSRSTASPLARKVIWLGHAPPLAVAVGEGVGTAAVAVETAAVVVATGVCVGPGTITSHGNVDLPVCFAKFLRRLSHEGLGLFGQSCALQ